MIRRDRNIPEAADGALDQLLDQVFLDLNPDDPSNQLLLEAVCAGVMGNADAEAQLNGSTTNRFSRYVRKWWIGIWALLFLGGMGIHLMRHGAAVPAKGVGIRNWITPERSGLFSETPPSVLDQKPEIRIVPLHSAANDHMDVGDTLIMPMTQVSEEEAPANAMSEMDTVPVSEPKLRNWRPMNDWERFGLRGRVRSVTQVSYKLENGADGMRKGRRIRSSPSRESDYKTVFNASGCRSETIRYNSNGGIYRTQIYTCDNQGRLIEERLVNNRGAEEVNRFIRNYDSRGNEIQILRQKHDGTHDSGEMYSYDSLSRITVVKYLNQRGELFTAFEYRYGFNQRVSELRQYAADSNLIMIIYHAYNESDIKVRSTAYLGFDSSLYSIVEFDQYENPIDEKWYDRKGRCHTHRSWEYTYDHEGNWTEARRFENERPKYVLERKFEYFNQ